jgi:GNAT superfamily N-acetyltransferase
MRGAARPARRYDDNSNHFTTTDHSARVNVRPARPEEVAIVLDVLADASAWLQARGIKQWPERFDASWVMPAIERGETWLAEAEREVVGTLVVEWEDELCWAGYPADAGYLHRLAVRRRESGLGGQLLRWAEEHTAAAGKPFLRLDCVAWNDPLRAYYERAGYEYVGDVTVGPYTQARYEKRVGD